MFEAFATLLKEKLYFFLEDIQKLKYFFFKRLILVTLTQIFGKPNGEIVIFSHGSNHSGVAIFFNKFKGNVLEIIPLDNGR